MRLSKDDTPTLLVINPDKSKSLYRAKSLAVVALKEGYYYWRPDGTRVPIPLYSGSLDKIRSSRVWSSLESIVLDRDGYISDGKTIIKISLGNKSRSVIVSQNPKRLTL